MRVVIAGIDGYLGWPLALHLAERGHDVAGFDALLRREWVEIEGGESALPILDMEGRLKAAREHGLNIRFLKCDTRDYDLTHAFLRQERPDVVVHLAENPSAPHSMIDVDHAVMVHENNVIGSLKLLYAMKSACPSAHLLKLGSMGEYGTPNIDIPEGFFELEFRGRRERLPFPRLPNSMCHLTKVHDSHNIHFACRAWGMRATDIMQGVVFGSRIDAMQGDPRLNTRFDIDQSFGTVINRFCAQAAAAHPLTLYGPGNQRLGFLPLRDSVQCFTLAIEHPPEPYAYRVFNQFQEHHSVGELARLVQSAGARIGLPVDIRQVENPRFEASDHHYNPDHQKLIDLGYAPTTDVEQEIEATLTDLRPYADRIRCFSNVLIPDIHWAGERRRARYLDDHLSVG